ncbi:MAG: citrate synthase [Phycisphaerales bacterium]|nr:citrate synthase [Phycisphaerales bacterium]
MSATASAELKSTGLEGLVAGKTTIASVMQDQLVYRGYTIDDLSSKATFEEVAFLLLVGHKPSPAELTAFKKDIVAERALPDLVVKLIKDTAKLPNTVPMDTLRSAISVLAHLDPDCQDNSPAAELRKSKRLLAKIPTIIGHMQNVIDGRDIVKPDNTLDHAANLLWMMSGKKPSAEYARVIDVSLILYAEHDFNASTFTGRVIAATLSDMHGAVTGAIAALKGPLHGGANEQAMEMLKELNADMKGGMDVEQWMKQAFAEKKKLMGFGHRVYKRGDHRAPILHALGREIAQKQGKEALHWFEIGEQMMAIMERDKQIYPNVDFPCGLTYFVMGIPVPQYTPIFVASRITGWCAHIMEQHENNRLIRPIAEYVGEGIRKW